MPGLSADVREPKTEAKHYIGESVHEEHVMEILFWLLWGYGVEMLRMALVGDQAERQKIDEKINQLQARLRIGRGSSVAPINLEGRRPRRQLSTAARKRIADAQRKRWAAFHKDQAPGTTAAKSWIMVGNNIRVACRSGFFP
jgi:hypothetical protein